MVKVAIQQPTFIPYAGYFQLMKEADVFILLDNVQFSKQSWQQRNKVSINDKDVWLTVPVVHKHGQLIKDVQISDAGKVYNIDKKLQDNFNYYLLMSRGFNLFELNMANILKIRNILGIDTDIKVASAIGETDIVKLTKLMGGTEYISTGGSRVYFDDSLENRFLSEGISITFRDFEPDYSIAQYLDDSEYLREKGLI